MPFAPFTPSELTAIDEVLAYQRTFLPLPPGVPTTNKSSELHIALDGTGSAEISRQVHPASGGGMDPAMKAAAASTLGIRIIHNHPSQGSLSASDWNVLAHYPCMEMTAVNSRGTTFRGKVIDASALLSWFVLVGQAEEAMCDQWERMVTVLYQGPDLDHADFAQANGWLVTFAIAERLRGKGWVEFECSLVGADRAAMSHPDVGNILQRLASWCAAAIL